MSSIPLRKPDSGICKNKDADQLRYFFGEQIYAFEGGKGAYVLPLFYKRGQMSTILHLLRGQMASPVNHLGGRCPHIPFFTGGQMSVGGNVRLPD